LVNWITKRKNAYGIVLLVISLSLAGSWLLGRGMPEKKGPQAVQGVLDLSGWDFAIDGNVALNGQWEFYWQQLLTPDDFAGNGPAVVPRLTGYLKVPSLWAGRLGEETLQTEGCGTYRLRVKLKPTTDTLGIKTQYIRQSHKLFVDGFLRGQSGNPGTGEHVYTSGNTPYTTFFSVQGDQLEIIVQVANYTYRPNSGIATSVYLGRQNDIIVLENRLSRSELIVFAGLFFIGLYHICVFFYRPDNRSLGYFGLYCLIMALAQFTQGQRLMAQFFPEIPFEMIYKIKSLVGFGHVVAMALFLKEAGRELIPPKLLTAVIGVFGSYLLVILLSPLKLYSYVELPFVVLQSIVYIVIVFFLCRSLCQKRYGNLGRLGLQILICAFTCIVMTILEIFLYQNDFLPARVLGDFGALSFVILTSLILVIRFSDAYDTIDDMSQRLLNLDKLKDEFLLNTSHELKTPLQGILTIAEAGLEGTESQAASRQTEYWQQIISISRRLINLINDILDFSRLKTRELRLQLVPVDSKSVVDAVLDVAGYMLPPGKIRLVQALPAGLPAIVADEDRLKQVLFNLIGNAVKFTREGEIQVKAELREGRLRIVVEDTGCGIPEERQKTIFDAFEQVEHRRGGTGIGLTISRQLVELMGGTLWLDWSEPGVGSRFAFELPVSQAAPELAADRQADYRQQPLLSALPLQTIKNGAFTILAVDDEPTNLQMVLRVFAQEDYTILTAMTAGEALAQIGSSRNLDLVLLDVMLPDMSGYELCRRIRERYSMLELPIIVLTACNSQEDIAAAFAAGANDFVAKPFASQEIRSRVRTLLSLQKAVKDVVRAEMAFLQSQIKPHFLYNALNTIVAFCYTDGEKAGMLLSEFSNYLRKSFEIQGTAIYTNLENELELVQSYVELEKARFGGRLEVHYAIDPQVWQVPILPLTIQPLVENAIQHGIMQQSGKGQVRITVKKEGGTVVITVADTGAGIPPDRLASLLTDSGAENTGIGLQNINRRLQSFYGQQLAIVSKVDEGTTVTFQIPVRPEPADE
jgi:two-component system sensor histidine kinase ChiS